MKGYNNYKIQGLDGLRALAALAVFGVHFQQKTDFQGGEIGFFNLTRLLINGNTGVALFFILSGFLLSIPFWRFRLEQAGWPLISNYWVKRLARIVPAYYLCLAILVINNQYWDNADKINDVLLHVLFLYNYSNDYFYSLNPPFWTIGIEMQFYLLMPLIFFGLSKFKNPVSNLLLLVLIVSCYLLHVTFMESGLVSGVVASHSVLANLPLFLIGVLIGQFYRNPEQNVLDRKPSIGWDLVFWVGSLLILIILASPLSGVLNLPHGRYNFPLVPLTLALVVISASRSVSALILLENGLIRRLGVISYGIYLFHLPIQNLTARFMKPLGLVAAESWLIFGVISLLATILFASLSYVYFERPIMRFIKSKG